MNDGAQAEAHDSFAEIAEASNRPQGTLRVAAPNDYGTIMVVPAVAEFLRRYPDCHADLRLNDRRVDLLEGELDVSIRVGWLADSSFKARRMGSFNQLLVASPNLLDSLGKVSSPEDLATLPFVANTALPDPTSWSFSRTDGTEAKFHAGPSLSIDTTQAVHAALLRGAGISVLPDFSVPADLAAGHLAHVLPKWSLPTGGIFAVFPSARFRPPRVAQFTEILIEGISHARND